MSSLPTPTSVPSDGTDLFLSLSTDDEEWQYGSQVNITWKTDYPTISLVLWQNYVLQDNTSYYDLLIDSQPVTDDLLYTVNTDIDLSLSREFFLRLYNGSSSDERNFDSDIISIVSPSSTSASSSASSTITSTPTSVAAAAAVTYVSPTTITATQTEYITPTASPTQTGSSGLSSGAKAGIGVGVGIGVPLLLALIFLGVWLSWRKRRQNKSPPSAPVAEPELPPIDKSGPQELDQTLKPSMHELDMNLKPVKMHELEPKTSIQNLAEMDAREGQAELEGSGNVREMP